MVVTARSIDDAERAAAELGEGATARALDLDSPASVAELAGGLEELDVLVNNAGVMGDYSPGAAEVSLEEASRVVDTNFWGPWRLTQRVAPLLRDSAHPRIVNVSSGMGQLDEMGGGAPGYRISKLGLNGLTRMLSQELAADGVLVNSMCPGWVRTDMGGRRAPRSVEEGADTAVWLATLPDDGPTGGFYRDRERIPW